MKILIGLLLLSFWAQAQHTPHNALSFQVGKTGFVYNLIYDYKVKTKNRGFQVSAGSNFGRYLQFTTVGAGVYRLLGRHNRFLELGLNYDYLFVSKTSDDQSGFSNMVYPDEETRTYFVNGVIGYRRYGRRTLFRTGLAPGFTNNQFLPGAYISFGILF